MTDAQIIALFGLLLSGFIVPIVKKAHFEQWVNSILALVVYAIGAVVVTFIQAGSISAFDAESFFTNFGTVFMSGTIGYVALWKSTTDEPIVTKVLP